VDSDDYRHQIIELQAERALVRDRNARVEIDKAWEQSRCRILFLLVITYNIASLVFLALGAEDPLLNACIPSVGFLISTLSLPSAK
jgi:hypothetical protein